MQITYLHIKNFKSIRDMEISGIENALILVGKNNSGKTAVLDAIRAVTGSYRITDRDFNVKRQNIEIGVTLELTAEDLHQLHRRGAVSKYKRFDIWQQEFARKLPAFSPEEGAVSFSLVVNADGKVRYVDWQQKKHNPYLTEILPSLHYIDTERELSQLQDDLLLFKEDESLNQLREGFCIFDSARECNHCFQCIGLINKKKPEELDVFETARMLEYKVYQLNLSDFSVRLNDIFRKNGGYEEIRYTINCDVDAMLKVSADTINEKQGTKKSADHLSEGMRSIYMLSLLETYVEDESRFPSIIIVEYPELFLHPQMQKTSSEILYRLSKKNQVIFSTHSPNLLFNFNSRQIKQVVLDSDMYSVVREKTDIDVILDDLGYAAGDMMNVSFVFIVEGKQDKSRLPLLLEKYYSELHDENGELRRIAIITTNSCTNIKTYANLKYMNQVYIKDQFLMVRDGDGKNPEELARQLCRYYDERSLEEADKLPKVQRKNVLILKYYSFENYFLNPAVMAKLGVVGSEEEFYEILWKKWQEYLHRLKSGLQLISVLGRDFQSAQDIKDHMEEFKIYMRGHNSYDIFYGRYKKQEPELLRRYIDLAPREDFADILDAVDRFIYFDSRRKSEG